MVPAASLVAFLLFASAASAASIDSPKRKSGLWDVEVSTPQAGGTPAIHMQQCVDQKSDDLMTQDAPGMEKMSCSKNETRREGDEIIHESVCKMDGSTARSRAVITGSLDSAYRVDIKTTYDPPFQGMREGSTAMKAKWLSPCKPAQKPGDVSLPSMPKMPGIDMEEMMRRAKER
ncbi:MAG: hypothetical protein QOD06_723 [Candidatus Binatota bacterium]|nr:hypothetical protein [Candidatus Binatota bacterium]